MPADSTPRMVAARSVSTLPVRGSTRLAPTRANATVWPAAMFGSAADDGDLLAVEADGGQLQAIGVGVRVDGGHPRHEHVVPRAANHLYAADLGAGHGEPVRQLLRRQVNVNELS